MGGCTAKNKSLGNYCDMSEETVSRYVRRLRELGYVTQTEFHGHYRVLQSSLHNTVAMEMGIYKTEKASGKIPGQGRASGLGSSGQSTATVPDKLERPCTLTKDPTKRLTYQGAVFDETGPEWKKFLIWSSKRLTRSSFAILEKVKIDFDGTILNIRTLISERLQMIVTKYFTEETGIRWELSFSEKENQDSKSKNCTVEEQSELSEPVKENNGEFRLMTEEDIRKAMRELERIKDGRPIVSTFGRIAA
ncbi:hypothetical protein LEP1GSC126_0049 [Leptospira kirschneri str. 200801774]|nr:hypothetical protein LEP1GSC126_0049 [Leptospira kirschneri str. 200801774]